MGGPVSSDRPRHERTIAEAFAAAAAAVARGDDLDDALAEMVGLACELTGARTGGLYVLDADHDRLEMAVTFGIKVALPADLGEVPTLAESQHPVAVAFRARRPQPIEDGATVPALRPARSALALPLVVRRDGIEISLGAMAIGFGGPLPDAATLAAAEPLADLAAVAVERALSISLDAERSEWFDRLAHTDPLTGLANRRVLDRMLELEVARAGRQGVPLTITLFEVDHLDEFERSGGNAASDTVLKRVAQVLALSVRLVDTIARYDDNRFILLAPGPDGHVVTDRLVRAIGDLELDGLKVSVSAGLVTYPEDGRTSEQLLAAAEVAMRAAREAGGGVVARTPAAE
jgi:diguanylate cyclase (GGDEF)-like protein